MFSLKKYLGNTYFVSGISNTNYKSKYNLISQILYLKVSCRCFLWGRSLPIGWLRALKSLAIGLSWYFSFDNQFNHKSIKFRTKVVNWLAHLIFDSLVSPFLALVALSHDQSPKRQPGHRSLIAGLQNMTQNTALEVMVGCCLAATALAAKAHLPRQILLRRTISRKGRNQFIKTSEPVNGLVASLSRVWQSETSTLLQLHPTHGSNPILHALY